MSKVDPHFKAIVALIAKGYTVNEALTSKPAFPVLQTWKWYISDKRFPDRKEIVRAARAKGLVIRVASRNGSYFSEAQYSLSLKILKRTNPAIPIACIDFTEDGATYHALRDRSKRQPEFAVRLRAAMGSRKWGGREQAHPREAYDRALDLISEIGASAYRQRNNENMPSYTTIHQLSLKDAAFRKQMELAVNARHVRKQFNRSADQFVDLYSRITASVSKKVDPEARKDIIQDVAEAVLSGRIQADEIAKECERYTTRHNRSFSQFAFASLDVQVFDDSTITRIDLLTADPACSWGM